MFSGDEGIRVVVVPLKPASDNKAIVSISGTGSEFDGKAQLCEVLSSSTGTDYKTTWQGRVFTVLVVREQWGTKEYRLGVPGKRDSLRLRFNDKATQELKAEDVYALHIKQSKDGTLATMQKFDRKAAEDKQETQLGEKLERLNKACESKISVKVNWPSITDDVLKSTSIASYCGNVLDGLRGLCSSKALAHPLHPMLDRYLGSTGQMSNAADIGGQNHFGLTRLQMLEFAIAQWVGQLGLQH